METSNPKPLGGKNYGSIAHLPGSRMGPGDHSCHVGQERICNEKARDKHDLIIVQEKLDGSNVGVAKLGGQLRALTRAGYLAHTSPYEQHPNLRAWSGAGGYWWSTARVRCWRKARTGMPQSLMPSAWHGRAAVCDDEHHDERPCVRCAHHSA